MSKPSRRLYCLPLNRPWRRCVKRAHSRIRRHD